MTNTQINSACRQTDKNKQIDRHADKQTDQQTRKKKTKQNKLDKQSFAILCLAI